MPSKLHTSKSPCRPASGSQKLRAVPRGLRGNDPGGYALPRSRTTTDLPASARRNAATDPPNPDPTTTTSACSVVGLWTMAWDSARRDSR